MRQCRARDTTKPKEDKEKLTHDQLMTSGLFMGEWSRPFCSWPWVGGPKPVVGDHQIGFSPDDRKIQNQTLIIINPRRMREGLR